VESKSDTPESTGSMESLQIVYRSFGYSFLLMHGGLFAVLFVLCVMRVCAAFRSFCMAVRSFSCDQVRCRTHFRCASEQDRRLEAQVNEVQKSYFFTFGPIHVVAQMCIIVFCHITSASAEQSVHPRHGWHTDGMVTHYAAFAPMYISATAMMLMLGVLPKSTSTAWLNALNITTSLSVVFFSAVPDRIRGFPVAVDDGQFRGAFMLQISQSWVCGNPKLSALLVCSLVLLKAIQQSFCCSDFFF